MSRTILIVDDSKTERVVLNGYLKADYDLIEAASGEEVIEILRTQWRSVSAIVLDIVMPGMDGFETLKAIKANAQWLPIPVVITTGLDDEDSREKAVTLGADSFVTKPFNKSLLLHVVGNVVQLREMAAMVNEIMRDRLTGLLSRDSFFTEAERMIRRREPGYYTLSCMDIENFKVINDQYGTETGDKVLQHIAQTLNGFIGGIKGLCGRYMADKFAILYPTKMKDSREIAENHAAVATPNCVRRPLRLRIGRCLVNDTSLPVSAIFDRAAMAEARGKGRYDTYIIDYDESMRDSILQEQQIVGDMVDALKNGEFEPWFQPQYNHATGALIGAEALVRWRRNGEIILPNEFIPVFEKNGFIYEVDQFMWRQVCALLRRWLDEGKNPLPISVNISRHDMFQENFVGVLTGLIAEYGLPAELLRLEITESAFSAATNVITDIVGKLIAAGFTVEIDDFGSGYSSLNTLKDIPASILKLDMRFFETTENSSRGGNIVEAVVRMAKWLGMSIIAEGVEDKAQADYLKSIGCYYIQGYYYSEPLTVEEYEKRMQEGLAEHRLSYLETLETLDSDLFWDPRSMETLIFNSYVGGACIFEYHGGKAELLRYNDQFVSELRGLIPQNAEIQDVSIVPYLDDRSKKELVNALQKALESGKEASSEMRLTKGEQTEYVGQTSRVIAKTSDSTLYYCVIQNLTNQRKLERERTESAERLSSIMSNINGGVSASVFHDEKHIEIVFANDGFYKLFGYTEEQFEAEVSNAIDPILLEDRDKTTATVARIVRERGSGTYEYRCRKRDGSVIWIQTTNTVISLAGVGDTVLLATTTDITELRRAQEQSRETSDRLSAVMNAMKNGMTAVTVQEHMQFLFANDCYYQIHGIVHESSTQDMLPKAFSMIHSDDRQRIRDIVMSMTDVGQSAEAEYRINLPDGTVRFVKTEITVTNLIGVDTPVQVAIYTDITDEKKASEQLRFLNESAGEILAQPDSEKAINNTLQKLLNYFAGERSYIFELDDMTQTSDNTYELCAPGVTPELQRLQGIPYDTQQNWFDAFRKIGFVAIPDVAAIEEGERAIRELLLVQNISSIIVAPLWRDGRLIGYIGVDNPTKAVDQVSQLIALSDYIAVLLTRRDLMKAVEQGRQTVQQLMDDTPGGFVRVELFEDKNPVIVSVNDGICSMLGMTRAAVMQAYGDNVFACLAEEDAAAAPDEIMKAYASGSQYTSTCRLRKKDGDLFWVMLFGRFVHGKGGKLYLNAYFTDITEQRNVEQLQLDLLDNLPFGAAMFAYDGKSLTALHVNKQYTATVNREVNSTLEEFDPLEAIHPDDRQRVFDEIRISIAEKRNATCDIRMLYSGDEYRFFHLDASIVPSGDGKYVLYVVYERITDLDKELKETSERLKLLSDSIPGGIATFRCMPKGIQPLYYNDGICTLLGYSREEFEHSRASLLGLVFDEDKPVLRKQFALLLSGATALNYSVRIHTKNGGYKWVECVASMTGREGENVFLVSAVLTDVTVQHEEHERLRVSEELNRLAMKHSGKIVAQFDIKTRALTMPESVKPILGLPRILANMPEEQIALGRISPDTADVYRKVFEDVASGSPSGEAIFQQRSTLGWRWIELHYTTVFSSMNEPISAVVTFDDVTEQLEKEMVYHKWQQSLNNRPVESYTLFRFNLSKNSFFDSCEGALIDISFTQDKQDFSELTAGYALNVFEDDRERYLAFINSDAMLAGYYRGRRADTLEYREVKSDGSVRWLKLSVELVEYPNSTDVEVYLMYEDINEAKLIELQTKKKAETDPLTGVLNRTTFAMQMDAILRASKPEDIHALMLVDIDEFKCVNDTYGHEAGDRVLCDLTKRIRKMLRKDDLVGRLGGDEFFVFLKNIPGAELAAEKARQICESKIPVPDSQHTISVSIGVARSPKDGDCFDALYKKADAAMYKQKTSGKNGFHLFGWEEAR